LCFFFQAEDGIRDRTVTGVQTCALPICQILGRAGFEIMDPNIVGHAAAIMFPGPELAENAVERHFRIVRRKGRESAAWHRHLLQIGRASCRERVETWVGEGSDGEKKTNG